MADYLTGLESIVDAEKSSLSQESNRLKNSAQDCWHTGIDNECISYTSHYPRHSQVNKQPHLLRQSDKVLAQTEGKKDQGSESKGNETANSTEVEEQLSDYEYVRRNFYFFNRGFKGHELARNFSNCGMNSIYWWFFEIQTYEVKMTYSSFGEGTFNSTLFLQNTTQLLFICTDTSENLYYWVQMKFDQFPTWNDFFLGFL